MLEARCLSINELSFETAFKQLSDMISLKGSSSLVQNKEVAAYIARVDKCCRELAIQMSHRHNEVV